MKFCVTLTTGTTRVGAVTEDTPAPTSSHTRLFKKLIDFLARNSNVHISSTRATTTRSSACRRSAAAPPSPEEAGTTMATTAGAAAVEGEVGTGGTLTITPALIHSLRSARILGMINLL